MKKHNKNQTTEAIEIVSKSQEETEEKTKCLTFPIAIDGDQDKEIFIRDARVSMNRELFKLCFRMLARDFPGSTVDENPYAKAGDTDSIPGPGRFHMLQSN